MDYKLIDAKCKIKEYCDLFIEYCDELSKEDETIKNYDFIKLAMENIESDNDHPYLIYVNDNIAGLFVSMDEDISNKELDLHDCHTYLGEIYIKKEYRKLGLASKITLEFIDSQKYDTGFCYIVGSYAEKLWLKLLDDNNYKYKIFKEDNIRNFVHVYKSV